MKSEKIKSIINIFLIIIVFIFFSYIIQKYSDFFNLYLDFGYLGMLMFVLIVIISIVFAPVSAVPLFPLASGIWGWFIAAILAVIGWTIGAVIAFLLARKYGVSLVKKVLPIEKIHKFEKNIPDKNIFWTVVFFRMVTPVDGLSYFLGLFSKMSLKSYTLATFIGITPFSFVIAYVGAMPFYYQVVFLLCATVVFVIGLLIAYYRHDHKHKIRK